MGYILAEDRNLRQEQKVFGEIGEMLKEAEAKIEDINFPVENLDFLREGSIFVKSKLELGILDSNPLLKSRAENFVHNVNKIEMKNQDTLTGLLEQVGSNTKKLGEQVEVDVSRIEKHTKRRKLLFMAGGAILGGAASFFGPGLLDKALGKVVVGEPEVDSSSSNEGGAPEVYKGTSDWKNEPDPWKSGQSDPDPWKSDVAPSMDSSETGVSTEGVDESMQSGTTVAQEQPTHFEDTIDSSEMSSGSDSIWRSAKAIFTGNAEALGYKGDLNDAAELSRWAEAQTASAVNGLNAEQGGNLADLVHDNDVVKIDIVNGKPVLSFDDASGINASHLSDTNVEKFFSDTKFEGGVEHEVQMDAQTGDQFVSLQTEDGVVKVYDWDRDGNPNVVMPDGSHQEMSTEQLKVFMEERNVAMTAEEVVTEDARVAELTRVEGVKTQIDGFLVGDTEYSNDMYAVAKADGKLDDVLHKMLSDNNTKQLEQFVGDYFKDNNMGDDKRVVFLHEISKLYGTDELRNYDGSMKRLMGAFESNVTRNYREMEFAFDQASGDKEWVPVAVGEKYALVRHDARFMRKDLFYIDINGDGVPDAIKDADAMKEVFDGKVPLATERIELDNDKTFSLKRPEASTATPDSQSSGVSPEVAAVTTDPKAVSADVVPKTVQPDLSTKEMPKVVETPLTTDAIPVLETKSADLPPNIKVDIDNNAFKVMAERGIAFKGGSLDVPGTGPIVFSKEAADTLGISPEDKGVTDTIKITTHNDLLDVEVTDKDGGVDNLVLDKDNKIIDVKHEDGVSSDTKVTQSTGVETSVEKPMDPIDYAIGTLNAGKESLNFELAKINDYDVDYLSKVKAFTEAQLAAIGKDTTNPRAISLREGMEIIDKEVAIRLKGFDSPSV
ncbi:MAG: hypothetical protein HN730_02020 [Bdellovibrionales bacterium]|nr:hypothetical protein [Bdellovibrionales bacterium]